MGISLPSTGAPASIGFVHGQRNYLCRNCGNFTSVPQGAPDPDRCTTPGCSRPTGFGGQQGLPRPDRVAVARCGGLTMVLGTLLALALAG